MGYQMVRGKVCISRTKRGFTLVELLVTILILAIIMAAALPLYLSAVAYSQRRTCRENERTIGNAVQADYYAKQRSGYGFYFAAGGNVTVAKCPDLKAVPVCPGGGTYKIHTGSSSGALFEVECSIGSHGGFNYGVDSE